MADRDPRRAFVGRRVRLRRLLHRLRTEHSGPGRDATAVAVGVFIGCTPLYGLHLALSLLAGWLFRLNRLKVYVAANISNPLLLPLLLFVEIQAGAWLRRGTFHALTREAITAVSPWTFGLDLVVGSVVFGATLAVVLGTVTYIALRPNRSDEAYWELVERAAERFAGGSFTAWEFANAKLHADPVYRHAMRTAMLPGGDTLVDIGCGQGLMLALLLEAHHQSDANGAARHRERWPFYGQLVGVEARPKVARLAATALDDTRVNIITGDATTTTLPACDAALLFDVLHMMPADAQRLLLAAVRRALRPGGVVLIREADAGAGWGFTVVRVSNRLKAVAFGHWGQSFAFRPTAEWLTCFREAGFDAHTVEPRSTSPVVNVLFRLSLPSPVSYSAGDRDS